MCLISAKPRVLFRALNNFNTSDLLLAEVTERAIVQKASRPILRSVAGREALILCQLLADKIAHNELGTQS